MQDSHQFADTTKKQTFCIKLSIFASTKKVTECEFLLDRWPPLLLLLLLPPAVAGLCAGHRLPIAAAAAGDDEVGLGLGHDGGAAAVGHERTVMDFFFIQKLERMVFFV